MATYSIHFHSSPLTCTHLLIVGGAESVSEWGSRNGVSEWGIGMGSRNEKFSAGTCQRLTMSFGGEGEGGNEEERSQIIAHFQVGQSTGRVCGCVQLRQSWGREPSLDLLSPLVCGYSSLHYLVKSITYGTEFMVYLAA